MTYRPHVLLIAGPNGAGKSTAAPRLLRELLGVAEYVNAREGLGQLIQNARRFSAMDQVFAGILVIIALALVTYQLMVMAKRRLYPWEGSQ